MRVLKFDVSKQIISKNENCDFNGIIPGSKGYLKAMFKFSKEWSGCAKAAVFKTADGTYPMPITDNSCIIPGEALTGKYFRIEVIGEKDGYRIRTNRLEVRQDG